MKKFIVVAMLVMAFVMAFTGCANDAAKFKVGMVTDAGTIDDKSFNQGTWEGVEKAAKELKIDYRYLKPSGTTEADYLTEIGNLYDAGFKMIVTPGIKFETAIFQAQVKYPDAKFVLLDGEPHTADYSEFLIAENTVSIIFAEEQAGFAAGIATAIHLNEGELGFIGGMEVPAVQRFNWGFQQGVAFANENYSTSCNLSAENVIYQGTFDQVEAGQQLAAAMYDKGVVAIFCAAGGVGVGAINEAKTRAQAGEEVWIIGVDKDQYAEGLYDDEHSIILTSATKLVGPATYSMIIAESKGEFRGGEQLLFDATNDSVGIPAENPNLSAEAQAAASEALVKIKSGELVINNEQGDLLP